jgi:hypothetical protein
MSVPAKVVLKALTTFGPAAIALAKSHIFCTNNCYSILTLVELFDNIHSLRKQQMLHTLPIHSLKVNQQKAKTVD